MIKLVFARFYVSTVLLTVFFQKYYHVEVVGAVQCYFTWASYG